MLRSFVYLNQDRLDEFIGQVEDGLRQIRRRTDTADHSKSGGADVKIIKGDLASAKGSSDTSEFSDSAPARFARLLDLVDGHETDFNWVEVMQDADLADLRVGSIIDVSADLYESDITKVMGPNGVMGLLPLLSQMQDAFSGWKTAAEGLPDARSLDAMGAFASRMPEMILFGDIEGSETRIVCVLPAVTGAEGDARVVGKVRKIVAAGSHEPLPGTPFLEQMPRSQRREYVAAGPQPGQEMMWLEGPVVIIDVLAIWR